MKHYVLKVFCVKCPNIFVGLNVKIILILTVHQIITEKLENSKLKHRLKQIAKDNRPEVSDMLK